MKFWCPVQPAVSLNGPPCHADSKVTYFHHFQSPPPSCCCNNNCGVNKVCRTICRYFPQILGRLRLFELSVGISLTSSNLCYLFITLTAVFRPILKKLDCWVSEMFWVGCRLRPTIPKRRCLRTWECDSTMEFLLLYIGPLIKFRTPIITWKRQIPCVSFSVEHFHQIAPQRPLTQACRSSTVLISPALTQNSVFVRRCESWLSLLNIWNEQTLWGLAC